MISASPWARAACQEGSYLVLPFIGPLPPRDLVGSGVDGFFDPLSWARFPRQGHLDCSPRGAPARAGYGGPAAGTSSKPSSARSIDFYATTRNLYRQSRNAQIRGDGRRGCPSLPESLAPQRLKNRL